MKDSQQKNQTSKERYLTYNQWKSSGYSVLKGEKSASINEEFEATFSSKQVTKYIDDEDYELYDYCPYANQDIY